VPQDAQGLSCSRKPPCALKCIETSAVCNSKMRFGTNSVIRSEFGTEPVREPREDARVRMAQLGKSNPAAKLVPGDGHLGPKNDGDAQVRAEAGGRSCKPLQKEDHSLSTSDSGLGRWPRLSLQFHSRHFCAIARHLSAPSTASDESWRAATGAESVYLFACPRRQTSRASLHWTAGGGCPHMSVYANRGGGSLDLSIRQMFK
jgi:hypothetical protein